MFIRITLMITSAIPTAFSAVTCSEKKNSPTSVAATTSSTARVDTMVGSMYCVLQVYRK